MEGDLNWEDEDDDASFCIRADDESFNKLVVTSTPSRKSLRKTPINIRIF